MHYLGSLEFPVICDTHKVYLIHPMIVILKTHGLLITFGTLSACFQSEGLLNLLSLHAFIGLPFALMFTCTFTECVTKHHEVHNHEFWKTTHMKVPSKFSQTSFYLIVIVFLYAFWVYLWWFKRFMSFDRWKGNAPNAPRRHKDITHNTYCKNTKSSSFPYLGPFPSSLQNRVKLSYKVL